MEKLKLNELIVVEGKSDIDFLSSFIDAEFYSVNGSAINKKDINFIKKISLNRKIIVLTDPDFPGKRIRNIINENVENVFNAYVRKEFSIKNHKVGVAESTKDEVLRALKNLKQYDYKCESDLSLSTIQEYNLTGTSSSQELRDKICDYLVIEHCNSKQFLKRLRMLGINESDLKEIIENVNGSRN